MTFNGWKSDGSLKKTCLKPVLLIQCDNFFGKDIFFIIMNKELSIRMLSDINTFPLNHPERRDNDKTRTKSSP